MRDLILSNRVHTHRGLIFEKDLLPGDKVFEYGTGKSINVLEVKKIDPAMLYNIDFNDGRNLIVREDDFVFDGANIVPFHKLMTYNDFPLYSLYPFNPKETVIESFNLDPYTAGRFLTFGKYDYDNINLPLHLYTKIPDSIEFKYHIESDLSSDKDGVVFFKYEGHEEYIKWKDFLNLRNSEDIKKTFVLSKRVDADVFPPCYINGSIKCREKMVAGIFDFGYDKQNFPYNIMIGHDIVGRLKAVQSLLWSLGITSNIRDMGTNFSEHIKGSYKTQYVLEVTGVLSNHPGLFYNIDYIKHHLHIGDKGSIHQNNTFRMKIKSVRNITDVKSIPSTVRFTRVLYEQESYRILLDKPKSMYVTENYLPKISL